MSGSEHYAPLGKRFFTPGMKVLTGVMLAGLACGLFRMIFGLGAATNLDNRYPWGLWIGADVASGVALAAGGFTSCAIVYVFRREHFHVLIRPALLTAMLGYTFVAIGLLFDLGRWYNVWHPMLPSMWQGNSVLFEVGMCVMCYLTVLYIEFIPIVCERFMGHVRLPGRWARLNDLADLGLRFVHHILGKVMFVFVLAGITLSCLHQSSLGTLLVLAPYKMHPLYWSPIAPLLFLTSAIAVGPAMVIFESIVAAHAFDREPEMHALTPLARIVPFLMGAYALIRVGDLVTRGAYVYLLDGSTPALMFWIEFVGLTLVPLGMFLSADIRRSPRGLFMAASLYVVGILLNRCTVFFIAYRPAGTGATYLPALTEVALTVGLVCAMVFIYRLVATFLPVLPAPEAAGEGRAS